MAQQGRKSIRFGSSWSTQFRLTQALGRGLASLMPVDATVVLTGSSPMANLAGGEIDVCFLKSVNNVHRYTGVGLFAGDTPDIWLRTIAWLPQEDRMLFAMAPWTNIASFEQLAKEKPVLHMAGGSAPQVLKEYGFSYDDIKEWGGSVSGMEHTATEAQARFNAGTLDALFGGPAPRSQVEAAALSRAGEAAPGIRSSVGDPKTQTVAKGRVTRDILAAPQGDGGSAQAVIPG